MAARGATRERGSRRRLLAAGAVALLIAGCGGGDPTVDEVAETVDAAWADTAQEFRERVGERFAFVCPQRGTAHTVWGSDSYTDDSSVCTAAVHAGEIDFGSGGTVVIEMEAGRDSYDGSERNGVSTSAYGEWPGGFTFP
jgi:hypothetical protein